MYGYIVYYVLCYHYLYLHLSIYIMYRYLFSIYMFTHNKHYTKLRYINCIHIVYMWVWAKPMATLWPWTQNVVSCLADSTQNHLPNSLFLGVRSMLNDFTFYHLYFMSVLSQKVLFRSTP